MEIKKLKNYLHYRYFGLDNLRALERGYWIAFIEFNLHGVRAGTSATPKGLWMALTTTNFRTILNTEGV